MVFVTEAALEAHQQQWRELAANWKPIPRDELIRRMQESMGRVAWMPPMIDPEPDHVVEEK